MRIKTAIKRKFSVCLFLLFAAATVLGVFPQAKLEAQAASEARISWEGAYDFGWTVQLEIQMTKDTYGFHVGDYLSAASGYGDDYKNYGYLSMNKGVTYSSSNLAVASVDETGLVNPKKAGSTNVTVKFKGASAECTIKVVSSLGKDPSGTKYTVKKQFQALDKAFGQGITAANRYNIVNVRKLYGYACGDESYSTYSAIGKTSSGQEYTPGMGYIYKYVWKAYNPAIVRADRIGQATNNYIDTKNPLGTEDNALFRVTEVSGKGSTVTAKLSKKVTAEQIFAIKAVVSSLFDSKIAKGKKAEFPVYIRDSKSGYRYYAIAIATQGKNTLSIKLQGSKLKKGAAYKLAGYNADWREANLYPRWTRQGKTTFKAK